MAKLYEITNEYQKSIDLILSFQDVEVKKDGDNRDYDLTGSLEAELSVIKDSFEDKAIAVAKYIRNCEAEAFSIIRAMEDMKKRVDRLHNKADSLREYLKYNIEQVGLAEAIKCPEFEIKIKTNPESLEIYDELSIPETYLKEKVVKTIDKVAIKKDIQAGFDVEGTRIVRNRVLVIK